MRRQRSVKNKHINSGHKYLHWMITASFTFEHILGLISRSYLNWDWTFYWNGTKDSHFETEKKRNWIRNIEHTLSIANTTVWYVVKTKILVYWSTQQHKLKQVVQTTRVDDRKVVKAMRKTPKQLSVTLPPISTVQGRTFHNTPFDDF